MRYASSAELYKPATYNVLRCAALIRNQLEPLLAAEPLGSLDMKLIYVPIIMPAELLDWYKERSRNRLKQRECVCAPQLDYQTFVEDDLAKALSTYVAGLSTVTQRLSRFGASGEQIESFDQALHAALAGATASTLS